MPAPPVAVGPRPSAPRPALVSQQPALQLLLPQATARPAALPTPAPPLSSPPDWEQQRASHTRSSARGGLSPSLALSAPARSCDRQTRRSRSRLLLNDCNIQFHSLVCGGCRNPLDFAEANALLGLDEHVRFALGRRPLDLVG